VGPPPIAGQRHNGFHLARVRAGSDP